MKYRALLATAALAVSSMSNAVPVNSDGTCAARMATINRLHATARDLAQLALLLYLGYPQTRTFYFGPYEARWDVAIQLVKLKEMGNEPATNYSCQPDGVGDYAPTAVYSQSQGPGLDLIVLYEKFWGMAELDQLTVMVHEWGHGARTYGATNGVGGVYVHALADHQYAHTLSSGTDEGSLRALALLAGGAIARKNTDNYAYFVVDPHHKIWRPW